VNTVEDKRPKVGIGVIIVDRTGKILVGKREGSHANYYSIPGGHLELGETFEEAAVKEVKEETSLTITDPKVICVTNNIDTFNKEGKHYISVSLVVHNFMGNPKAMEPEKCREWFWVNPKELPEPHFDASRLTVKCFLENKFYVQ
jgi:8-oxo-dGTP diphosphatase